MEHSSLQPAETWDYGAGDVWYFRPYEGHMVQGLQDGCTFVAGTLLLHYYSGAQMREQVLEKPNNCNFRNCCRDPLHVTRSVMGIYHAWLPQEHVVPDSIEGQAKP